MNRELKFKVWDRAQRKLITPSSITFNVNATGRWLSFKEGCCKVHHETAACADRYTTVEFTGLKDKNGREIYEGDIATYQLSESTSEHDTVRFVVEWGDCGWIMQDIDLKCCVGYLTCAIKTYEVIGNIYENPELV